jgi:hypothetical protein
MTVNEIIKKYFPIYYKSKQEFKIIDDKFFKLKKVK